MKANRDWIQIVSNFAVIAGLILVAMELNQSQRIAIVQSQQDWTAIFNESMSAAVNSPYAPLIQAKLAEGGIESLSNEELVRFQLQQTAMAARLDMLYLQYQEGFLSEETYESTFKGAVRLYAPLWKQIDTYYELRRESFRDEVERILQEQP
ncbi:MAG: hypothetical protein R3F41_11935 [Gammaproteobacteria bacterium]